MSATSGVVTYDGKIMSVRDFLKDEIRIGIERYDLEDSVRTLTSTKYEPDLYNAAAYLYEEIEKYKNEAPKNRPKFELVFADKYSNKIW